MSKDWQPQAFYCFKAVPIGKTFLRLSIVSAIFPVRRWWLRLTIVYTFNLKKITIFVLFKKMRSSSKVGPAMACS